ncbi:malectin domain-containing carbohydrate-binding protein, partial [uncultured Algibacter sp.]|uniref:malectin domain-containing carbohydrate-binding protein n=1 Tax=uncultured Algibacter sp. TaxID=298659 RepID=UPI00260B5B0A
MKTKFFYLSFLMFYFTSKTIMAQHKTFIPDSSFEQALIDLGHDDFLDNYIVTSNIETITNLDVRFKGITDLTGIESFTELISLNCTFNNLTNLDLSNNTALTYLDCGFNNLEALDVLANKALNVLYCDYNNLTSLNVKNGNNRNFVIFNANSNPNLNCIEVDDAVYSNANWLNKDTSSIYCDNGGPIDTPNNKGSARINVGGNSVVESTDQGPNWEANPDNGAYAGTSYTVNTGINYDSGLQYENRHASIPDYIDEATFNDIFSRSRSDLAGGDRMEFTIPLADGNYTVNLFMGNSWSGASEPGERLFDILIEDALVENNMDLSAQFGHRVGGMKSYQVTVNDGTLNIAFDHEVGNPLINAIEIASSEPIIVPDNEHLARINVGGNSVVESTDQGPNWEANPD